MTSEITTKYYVSCERCGFGELVFPETFSGAVECPKCNEHSCDLRDKVVSRKDMVELIENKIEEKTENISRFKDKPQILLEELKQEIQNE